MIAGIAAGSALIAAGALLLAWLRRRHLAERIAAHGPKPLPGGLYRSRRSKAGGRRG